MRRPPVVLALKMAKGKGEGMSGFDIRTVTMDAKYQGREVQP